MDELLHEMWVRGYTPNGWQVSFTFKVENVSAGIAWIEQLEHFGITPNMPNLETGEKIDTVVTVVRREHVNQKDGSITPVIDFYPAWEGEFGRFRFCGIYLDTAEDVAEFERQAGVNLSDLPLYASQAPLQRNSVRPHQCEVKVKPFDVVKVATGKETVIDGKTHPVYKFSRYASLPQTATTTDRAALGGGEKPRIMGRDTTPAAVRDAGNVLVVDAPPSKFVQHMSESDVNPYNGQPATQPELAGVGGKRTEADINGMCSNFYQYAKDTYPQLGREDIHNLFGVNSMKDYFATGRWPADVRKELDMMVKQAAALAQKATA